MQDYEDERDAVAVDGRGLTAIQLARRRTQAVMAHLGGAPVQEIAELVGLSERSVRTAIRLHAVNNGDLTPKNRGKARGGGELLSKASQIEIRQALIKRPFQLQLADRVWTKDTAHALMRRYTNVPMVDRTLDRYLERWGILVPDRSSLESRTSTITQQWLASDKDALTEAAKGKYADIFWSSATRKLDVNLWPPQVTTDAINEGDPDDEVMMEEGHMDIGTDDDLLLSGISQQARKAAAAGHHKVVATRGLRLATAFDSLKQPYWAIFNATKGNKWEAAFLKSVLATSKRNIVMIRSAESHFTSLSRVESTAGSKFLEIFPRNDNIYFDINCN